MHNVIRRTIEIGASSASRSAAATICCLLLTVSHSNVEAQKGKPAPNPKVQVTIPTDPALGLIADQAVPYQDGVNGVEAQIWAGGSGDMTLRLYNTTRKFTVNAICATAGGCGEYSERTYHDGWFINIQQIWDMNIGETRWTRAHVLVQPNKNSTYSFDWCGSLTPSRITPVISSIHPMASASQNSQRRRTAANSWCR